MKNCSFFSPPVNVYHIFLLIIVKNHTIHSCDVEDDTICSPDHRTIGGLLDSQLKPTTELLILEILSVLHSTEEGISDAAVKRIYC